MELGLEHMGTEWVGSWLGMNKFGVHWTWVEWLGFAADCWAAADVASAKIELGWIGFKADSSL